MSTVYLWLARILAMLVVLQGMAITFMTMGMMAWIDGGGVLDSATLESWSQADSRPTWTGAIGYPIHTLVLGQMAIPTVALLLLIVSFFAKVPKGVMFAVILAVLVGLQIAAGTLGHSSPYFGLWHGLDPFLIFGGSIAAATAAKSTSQSVGKGEF